MIIFGLFKKLFKIFKNKTFLISRYNQFIYDPVNFMSNNTYSRYLYKTNRYRNLPLFIGLFYG